MDTTIGGSVSPAYAAAQLYTGLGLSVIPLLRGQKQPADHLLPRDEDERAYWVHLQKNVPSRSTLLSWFTRDRGCNIGIICGTVSKNLVVYDIDDAAFSTWVEQHCVSLLERFWVVRTGSGKLHLYCYNYTPVPSTVHTYQTRHLADLRSEGEYVVAPPSVHPKTGRQYETLYGHPAEIPTLTDAVRVFERIRDLYLARATSSPPVGSAATDGTDSVPTGGEGHGKTNGKVIPSETELLLEALRGRGLADRIWTALRLGVNLKSPDWSMCPSNSEADYLIIKALCALRLSDVEIIRLYTDLPIGAHIKDRRGTKGLQYIERTIARARRDLETAADTKLHAKGENFICTAAERSMTDPPTYILTLQSIPRQPDEALVVETVLVSHKALLSENVFREEVLRQSARLIPRFFSNSQFKGFPPFAEAVVAMAVIIDAPEEARGGYVRTLIRQILSGRHLLESRPASYVAVSLGWKDSEVGRAYFRGTRLISLLGLHTKQAPTPPAVWEAVRSMGGTHRRVALSDGTENLWALPLSVTTTEES